MNITVFEGLKVTLIGLAVVFAVLLLLIITVELLHVIFKPKKKIAKIEQIERKLNLSSVPSEKEAYSDGEFLSAVSAAISEYANIPNGSFVIKSIKERQEN